MIGLFLAACGGLTVFGPPDGPVDVCSAEDSPRVLRRLTHDEYARTVHDLFGVDVDPAAFAADPVVDGFRNDAMTLAVSDLLAEQYRSSAEEIAAQVDVAALVPCNRERVGDAGCAVRLIEDLGFEVFRRPLTQSDIDGYLALWTEVAVEDGYDEGVKWVLIAMLQSPHFLYRSELGVRGENGLFALTPWELATELSYDLLGTTPSRDLLDRVSAGLLADPSDIPLVAAELLADPRAAEAAADFAEVWLDTSELATVSRDGLTPELRDRMADDLRARVITLTASAGSLRDLLLPAEGDGVLLDPALLTTHGRPLGSGPVQRGMFVREHLLCEPLPPPPSNVDASPPPVDPTKTTREQYQDHSADPTCALCHDKIDPLGFAFEHYDQLGRYRELDNGLPIDDSGHVDGTPFVGPTALAAVLIDEPTFRTCFVSTWRRHATGLPTCGEDLGAAVGFVEPLAGVPALGGFAARAGGADEGDSFAIGERRPPDSPAPVPVPPAGVESTVDVTSDWGVGYCIAVTVNNYGTNTANWAVRLEMDGHIDSLWDAVVTEDGADWLFTGASWNATLPAGGQTAFGFCASR